MEPPSSKRSQPIGERRCSKQLTLRPHLSSSQEPEGFEVLVARLAHDIGGSHGTRRSLVEVNRIR